MRNVFLGAVVLAIAAFAASPADAKQKTVAGNWTLTTENLPLRLVLTQKHGTVTGTLDYPHGAPFRLTGGFTHDMLTLSGDSAGDNFTVHLDATASLNADGSMAGTIHLRFVELDDAHQVVRTRNQELAWTAVRRGA